MALLARRHSKLRGGNSETTIVVTHPVARPERNHLGEAAFAVAVIGFVLNLWMGMLLFGWLVALVGGLLGALAWVTARSRSWVCAVGALIATLASAFAMIVVYRDVVAPFLPS